MVNVKSEIASNEQRERNEKVILNVGGFRHETLSSTIASAPDTRLFWITEKNGQSPEYDSEKGEYFFDRNPLLFPYILNYYRTGKLHCPMDVCGSLFEEELQFWGIDESVIGECTFPIGLQIGLPSPMFSL